MENRLLTAVALTCAHLLGTDLPAMPITLAAASGLAIPCGLGANGSARNAVCIGQADHFVPGLARPSTDAAPGLERLLGIFTGSAMLDLLINIWPCRETNSLDLRNRNRELSKTCDYITWRRESSALQARLHQAQVPLSG